MDAGTIEAGGLAAEDDSFGRTRLQQIAESRRRINEQHAIANDAIGQGMGANAADRWSGTPAIGLGMFKRRDPIFGISGVDRYGQPKLRKRIDASTHMATPPSGLIGGKALEYQRAGFKDRGMASALTPQSQWNRTFPKYSAGLQPMPTTDIGVGAAENYDRLTGLA